MLAVLCSMLVQWALSRASLNILNMTSYYVHLSLNEAEYTGGIAERTANGVFPSGWRLTSNAGRVTDRSTPRPNGGVGAIVYAQAFQWFDREADRAEFKRILQDYGTDYHQVNHRNTSNVETEELERFFGKGRMTLAKFANRQAFDFEGLSGRLNSSPYAPAPGHPNHEPMTEELRRIFDATQQGGNVFFDYETEVYWGTL
ncbi:hypothetical protein [Saccharibacillus deserti]|uniref:hypothetical protein n=1 Tax=Saccharibacillus deserti TaxID=1634444 RepID=UPI0015535758|nr:hypothetical protein [Saccharibacillus deserti]